MSKIADLQKSIEDEKAKEKARKEELRKQREALKEKHDNELKEARRKRLSQERQLRREKQRAEDHARYQLLGEMVRILNETGKSPDLVSTFQWMSDQLSSGEYAGESRNIARLQWGMSLLRNRMRL